MYVCYLQQYTKDKVAHAVLTTICSMSVSPQYLEPLTHNADVPGRRTLQSAATNRLPVLL